MANSQGCVVSLSGSGILSRIEKYDGFPIHKLKNEGRIQMIHIQKRAY